MELEEQLKHCDGKDCLCNAYYPGECACDADWTSAEVYKLRNQLQIAKEALQDIRDGKQLTKCSICSAISHQDREGGCNGHSYEEYPRYEDLCPEEISELALAKLEAK